MPMKTSMPVLLAALAVLLLPDPAPGDGMFVMPKFVWDKHKDINEPSQKAILVYDAGREDLILQVKYEGPVVEFGWVVPVPGLPTVREGSMKCFYELSEYTQRLWEHPAIGIQDRNLSPLPAAVAAEPPPVKVIEIKTVGAYEVAVLAAKDSGSLARWLAANQFYFPPGKNDALDPYIKQQWYFVAVKINLVKSGFWFSTTGKTAIGTAENQATHFKLASGELNPLQISFASDRFVFPLKISSANGTPSEIQLYVLSTEPRLERTMLAKKLPGIYHHDLARAKEMARQTEAYQMRWQNQPLPIETRGPEWINPQGFRKPSALQASRNILTVDSDELPPFAQVTGTILPACGAAITRLADKTWWLTKQTWTFKPEEMRDLEFEPTAPVFADLLGSRYGYVGIAGLAAFPGESVPTLLAAFQNSNPAVRSDAASVFIQPDHPYGRIKGSRLTKAAEGWLKDPAPKVRMAGIEVLADSAWKPELADALLATLRDRDDDVRREAIFALPRFGPDLRALAPVFRQMLDERDPSAESSGLQILQQLGMVIPHASLLRFFESTDPETLAGAFQQVTRQRDPLNDADLSVLLRNSQPLARQFGLLGLSRKPERQSVELALPLLRDPDGVVGRQAALTLNWLTGQEFTDGQAGRWTDWWAKHKTKFVARNHVGNSRLPQNGRPYHDGGCDLYNRRNFVEALGDFRRACELGSEVQDYSQYRIWIIRARSGEQDAATANLVAYLKHRNPRNSSDWPGQIGRFLTGGISESDLFAAAIEPHPRTDQEQHCEAFFYAGAKRLVENDKAGATDCFKKCLATGVTGFEEYTSAKAELSDRATLRGIN